jgi:hypothetical protein
MESRRVLVFSAALCLAAALAGCGSDKKASDDPAAAPVIAYAKAADADAACAQLTRGFQMFFGKGDATACAKNFPFETNPADAKIAKIETVGDQKIVTAEGLPATVRFYVAKEDGAWKINSIGERKPTGPPPSP